MLTGTTFDKVYEDQAYTKQTHAWPMNAGTTMQTTASAPPIVTLVPQF